VKLKPVPVDSFMVSCPDDIGNIFPWLSKLKTSLDFADDAFYFVVYEKADVFQQRSHSQNGLYWQWMQQLATHFNGRTYKTSSGEPGTMRMSKDDAHDLMRHNFLGYEERTVGRTNLQPRLISTASLSKGEMSEYMHKVDAWSQDHGVRLTYPNEGEYAQYKEART